MIGKLNKPKTRRGSDQHASTPGSSGKALLPGFRSSRTPSPKQDLAFDLFTGFLIERRHHSVALVLEPDSLSPITPSSPAQPENPPSSSPTTQSPRSPRLSRLHGSSRSVQHSARNYTSTKWHKILTNQPDHFKNHVRSTDHQEGFEDFMKKCEALGDKIGAQCVDEYSEAWHGHHKRALTMFKSLRDVLKENCGRPLSRDDILCVRKIFEEVEICRRHFQTLDENAGVYSRFSNDAEIPCQRWWPLICQTNGNKFLKDRLIIQGKDHGSKVTVFNARNATDKIFVYLQDGGNNRDTPAPIGFDFARNEAIWKKPEELIPQLRPDHPLFRKDDERHTGSSLIPQHYQVLEASSSAVNVRNTTSIIGTGEDIVSQDHEDNESFKTANSS